MRVSRNQDLRPYIGFSLRTLLRTMLQTPRCRQSHKPRPGRVCATTCDLVVVLIAFRSGVYRARDRRNKGVGLCAVSIPNVRRAYCANNETGSRWNGHRSRSPSCFATRRGG
ncbi:hypothetical protein F4774DRAFT_353518 [Daldinia eschscholtzii]|nr:hypothetical protein F4774DRAFT_353518 [Daldinia eschscholtzii]